jgi:hypothetical protein
MFSITKAGCQGFHTVWFQSQLSLDQRQGRLSALIANRSPLPSLTHRKLLQFKAIAIESDLRGTLRNFGLKVGIVGKVKF